MRALLALSCVVAACAPAAAAAGAKTVRALPPFSSLDLGRDGCMPIGIRVVEGTDYALEIVAEDGIEAHVASKVSSSGELSVYVSDSFRTTAAVGLTVFAPPGALQSVWHGGSAPLLVTAPTAASFELKASGGGVANVAAGPVAPGGSVTIALSGTADVLLCAPEPTAVSALDARLFGTAHLHVSHLQADTLSASLTGLGDLTLSGAPAASAQLRLSGTGKLSAAARRADVDLGGMGDVYVSGADAVAASISGMGNVHYAPASATCRTSGFGMGSCSPGEAPPPRLRCSDHGGKELDQGNARGFVVDVSGSQCQVHIPELAAVL